jgi:hypothetical protein
MLRPNYNAVHYQRVVNEELLRRSSRIPWRMPDHRAGDETPDFTLPGHHTAFFGKKINQVAANQSIV